MKTIEALRKLHRETKADVYLVGGFVRDFLRNKSNDDLDIVVRNASMDVIKNFLKDFGSVKPVQLNGGTHLLLFHTYDDKNYAQITLPRRGKIQIPDPKNTLTQDSKFRDFKLNAMYLPINYKSKKDVIDKVGGKEDIKNRRIVAVGSAAERLRESPDRILRAISLSARTGYTIDDGLLEVIKTNIKLVHKILPEQIKKELNYILLSRKPSKYFRLMHNLGILPIIIPELSKCVGVRQDKRYHKYDVFTHQIYTCDNIEPDLILRFAGLFHDIGKPDTQAKIRSINKITFHKHESVGAKITKNVMTRLKYSTSIIKKVSELTRLHMYHYTSDMLKCAECGWNIVKDKTSDGLVSCPSCNNTEMIPTNGWTDAAVRRFISNLNITKQDLDKLDELPLFKLRAAERLGNGYKKIAITDRQKDFQQRIIDVYNESKGLTIADLDIDGRIIMKIFNMDTSPEIGDLLKFLLEKVLEHPPLNNRLDLIKLSSEFLFRGNYI